MRVLLQTAYILHQRPYRDTSLLLEAFTPDYGRVSLIAKGVRGSKSGQRALLQPFQALKISWSGRSQLHTLIAVEMAEQNKPLKGDALYSGFYINELLMHLLHVHDPHEYLFELYHQTILRLSEPSSLQAILRYFEKQLLQQLGYGLQLLVDASGEAIEDSAAQYSYQYEQGAMRLKGLSGSEFPIISGRALRALHNDDYTDPQIIKEMRLLMRAVISHHLDGTILHSRELFRKH